MCRGVLRPVIVNLKYEDVDGDYLKGDYDGKVSNMFMRVGVDETNIDGAIDKLSGNKWVVALDYSGHIGFLSGIDTKGLVIIVKHVFDGDWGSVGNFMSGVGNSVRVVVELPSNYVDMREIEMYSAKYLNIRFCGGKLLRLDGCSVGCIGVKDIFKKVNEGRLDLVSSGCSCVYKNVEFGDLSSFEFYSDDTTGESVGRVNVRSKNTSKKQLSSLLNVFKEADNF